MREASEVLYVRIPDELMRALDDQVEQARVMAPGVRVTRATTVRTILTRALQREAPSRFVHHAVLSGVRELAQNGPASHEDVRRRLALLPAEVVERALVELEEQGLLVLGPAGISVRAA